jgi:Tfp pilus assembly PilM family ATPase
VLGLPSHLVNIRQVTVEDDLTSDDIEENIGFEAERALPIPLEEIYFDYWPIESQEEGKLNFIMVACPSNVITSRIEALAELKLDVVKVTINDYALTNFALETEVDGKTSALIYFRQDTATIIVAPKTGPLLCDHSTFKDHNIRETMQTLWDLIHIQQQQLSIQELYIGGHLHSGHYDVDKLTNHFQCSILEFDALAKNKLLTKNPILPTSLLAIALAHEVQS